MVRHDRDVGTGRLGQHVERNADFHRCTPECKFTTEGQRTRRR
jgi:hypothetical protein